MSTRGFFLFFADARRRRTRRCERHRLADVNAAWACVFDAHDSVVSSSIARVVVVARARRVRSPRTDIVSTFANERATRASSGAGERVRARGTTWMDSRTMFAPGYRRNNRATPRKTRRPIARGSVASGRGGRTW